MTSARLDRLAQRRAQVEAQTLARHRQEVPARRAERAPGTCRSGRIMEDIALLVHDDMGRREPLHHRRGRAQDARLSVPDAAAAMVRPARTTRLRRELRGKSRRAHQVPAPEDAVLLVDRGEQVAVPRHRLRQPQEEKAVGTQGVMEGGDNLLLQFRSDRSAGCGRRSGRAARTADRVSRYGARRRRDRVLPLQSIAAAVVDEEALGALRRDVFEQTRGIAPARATASAGSSMSVREDLHPREGTAAPPCARAAGSRSNRPPRRWRSPGPRRARRRRRPCPRTAWG